MTASHHALRATTLVLLALMLTACGSASPTPTPTTQPSAAASPTPPPASPTQAPTVPPPSRQTSAPTASASPTPTPSATVPLPTDAAGRLLAHIPAALRETCTTSSPQHALAAAECSPQQGGLTVRYTLYPDAETLDAAYATIAAQAQIEPDTGSCFVAQANGIVSATPDSWPSEQQYKVDGLPAGRYVCLVLANQPTIAWSDERLDILGQAAATSGDYDRLVTFWLRDSGPNR